MFAFFFFFFFFFLHFLCCFTFFTIHFTLIFMKELEHELDGWKGYVDYRFRPAQKGRHGGMRAALFVLGVEVLENLAFLANASNLVLYLSKYMNLPISKSANNVTNFMGTAFLLALLGGFLSDAYFTGYYIYLMSAGIEFLVIFLTLLLLFKWNNGFYNHNY
ncbi:putative proton-dependent oligopeptide transporter family, MFS transporter superfamily [Helianthus annuus]|nr:putative proton-dependent oligopeptide transporter family, MFS transporter superfamily [Helianthus annuus]